MSGGITTPFEGGVDHGMSKAIIIVQVEREYTWPWQRGKRRLLDNIILRLEKERGR